MSEPKTFASLGPMLLARKGGAKPAMRRQLGPIGNAAQAQVEPMTEEDLEDLGWNDMGEDEPSERHEAEIVSFKPANANDANDANFDDQGVSDPSEADAFADDELAFADDAGDGADDYVAVAAPVHRVSEKPTRKPSSRRRRAIDEGRRAAFTLRLDAERHLKLRLASTVKNRSAQYLVTKALDQFLANIPEIDALAAQVKRD